MAKQIDFIYTKSFIRQFERLPSSLQDLAYLKIDLFKRDQKSPLLKVHKLHGKLAGFLSFSIDFKTRVVFEYITPEIISFVKIGDHDVYR
jgi:mRNA-degrading endonuclease YafQ of YafQ-DinJ toxin-antitoxin module